MEPLICNEVGVYYSRQVVPHYREMNYTSIHIPTRKQFEAKVFVLGNQPEMNKLITFWNRTAEWHYIRHGCCQS